MTNDYETRFYVKNWGNTHPRVFYRDRTCTPKTPHDEHKIYHNRNQDHTFLLCKIQNKEILLK
jgi:protease II